VGTDHFCAVPLLATNAGRNQIGINIKAKAGRCGTFISHHSHPNLVGNGTTEEGGYQFTLPLHTNYCLYLVQFTQHNSIFV